MTIRLPPSFSTKLKEGTVAIMSARPFTTAPNQTVPSKGSTSPPKDCRMVQLTVCPNGEPVQICSPFKIISRDRFGLEGPECAIRSRIVGHSRCINHCVARCVCDVRQGTAVTLHTLDPLSDDRWDNLVARHARASVFHQRGWLQALDRTYGYKPFVLTSAPPGEPLQDGMVLCRASSWITGTRIVSLPFSDHCEPLLDDASEPWEFMNFLRVQCDRHRWKYVEIRSSCAEQGAGYALPNSISHWFHELDITPSLEQLFTQLHSSCFQRKIHKAERERLSYEAGRSEQIVSAFYRLLVATRKRHGLPPQPQQWFEHLVDCMGDNIQIRLARKDGVPIAAVLTLQHRSSVAYKYACSDARFHNLGGMPFLIWQLIGESKASGAQRIDFGRSDLDNHGLISFKDRLGAIRSPLIYQRYGSGKESNASMRWKPLRRWSFSKLPNTALSFAGRIMYRHIG